MIINGKVATDQEAAYAVEVKPGEVLEFTTDNAASGVDAAVDAVLNQALKRLSLLQEGFRNHD